MSSDGTAQTAHQLLLLVQIRNSPKSPSTNLFGYIPKPIQEYSKLASSTSSVRSPKMKHLVPVYLSIQFRLSSIKRIFSSVSICNNNIAHGIYIAYGCSFSSHNVINSVAPNFINSLTSRTTQAKILSYRATYLSNYIPCILNSHILSDKWVHFFNEHISLTSKSIFVIVPLLDVAPIFTVAIMKSPR